MRIGIVIVGVVVAIIGVALLFVPVIPQSNQSVKTAGITPSNVVLNVSGFSWTGSIPVSISWTSNTLVTVLAATCFNCLSENVSSITGVTIQTGTSGSFTLNQPDGGSIYVGAVSPTGTPATVTFKITTALTTVGSALLVVGIVLLIVGVILKSRKAKTAAATAPMPSMMSSPPQMAPPMSPPPPSPSPPPMPPTMGSSEAA